VIVDRFILAAASAAMATPALAHGGAQPFAGFSAGFLHPLSGLDHILAMVAVGLLAARFSGPSRWILPASFLAMMLMGGALGITGVDIPAVELVIAGSVATFGVAVAGGQSWPVASVTAFVGLFAVFHGYAHGVEIPAGVSAAAYSSGFLLASAALHLAGMGVGRWTVHDGKTSRSTGMAITLAGLALLIG
jgi:urease accessory protein